MKRFILSILLLMTVLFILGCKKNDEEDGVIKDFVEEENDLTAIPQPTNDPSENDNIVSVVPEENHDGEMRSYLNGLWVPVEIGKKRPYAIQFSNFKTVSNQSGIGQADIVYECLVEGGITRLLAIGQQFLGDRIGSIRSSRHYFVSLADEYDAIYIHYGKTKYAKSKIGELGINNLDGETGIGTTVFYRDKTIKAPHNAFTSLDRILEGIDMKDYDTEYEEGYEPHYSFYDTDTDLTDGSAASKVAVDFSGYNDPFFEYNETDKLYYRSQFDASHKDALTGEQLTFKNIIIQFVKEWDIDKNDYQTMDLEDASGNGYYITNGQMVPITWKKKEATRWMRYYNEAGEELTINPGKTYIALFPKDRTKDVEVQ
jgi:hypothetical protein